jgi:hypothetical protein
MVKNAFNFITILLLWAAVFTSPAMAMICMNGTQQLTCAGNPPVCPQGQVACSSSVYSVSGNASVTSTNVLNENGLKRVETTSSGSINFFGWECTGSRCTEVNAGSVTVAGGALSGSVSANQITSVNGNGENLDFYNGSTLAGSITISGSIITGSASASNGLLSVNASGTILTFTGMNCSGNNCSVSSAGTINIAGMSYSCPLGTQYPCGNTGSGYSCSNMPCIDDTGGGQFPPGAQVCAKDLNGDGTLEQNEIQQCTLVNGGMFCPIDAVDCNQSNQCSLGTYNTSSQRCESPVSGYSCPTGYTLSGSVCQAAPQCGSGSSYNQNRKRCEEAVSSHTCPSNYTWDSGKGLCTAASQCSAGSFNNLTQRCEQSASVSYTCSLSGSSYGTSSACTSACVQNGTCTLHIMMPLMYCQCSLWASPTYGDIKPSCPNCSAACHQGGACTATYSCGTGWLLSGTLCYQSATCSSGGSYNSTYGLCTANGTPVCNSGYTYDSASNVCYQAATCTNSGSLNTADNMCEIAGTTQCPNGTTYDSANNVCYTSATVIYVCPYGSQYTCLPNPSTGNLQCSDLSCFTVASQQTQQNSANTTSYQNDGKVDPSTGKCLGQIYIFNGKPSQCRPPGISTLYFNCCDTNPGSLWFIQNRCGTQEAMTVQRVAKKQCHYIGDYCQEDWWLVGCVQRADVYCCFGSELGRIIQEQGRPQLIDFNATGWGTTGQPDCRGFTPEEFQHLDFSKIDLSEYINDMVVASQATIQNKMQTGIQNLKNNLNK